MLISRREYEPVFLSDDGPVKDVTSTKIYCGNNNHEVPIKVPVKAGDTITFEWVFEPENLHKPGNHLDPSHKGPITVYIAPFSSNGEGDVWTKLAEDGWTNPDNDVNFEDADDWGEWATDRLIKNDMKHDVKLPPELFPGSYLLRAEFIALHEADTVYTDNPDRGAQFYPSCSQIEVTEGGNLKPPGNFDFKGGYTPTDPGIHFDRYEEFHSYPIPGPPVWSGGTDVSDSTGVTDSTGVPDSMDVPDTKPS